MKNQKPTLLLHACCAPCFSAVFDQVKDDFAATIFWFNPNVWPKEEYDRRLIELIRYAKIVNCPIIISDRYEQDAIFWQNLTKNNASDAENGPRCRKCINYRLLQTAQEALKKNFDLFGTTLTVSPHKDSALINSIGTEIMKKYDIPYLDKDFGQNDGYRKSIEICKAYKIYRQKYCGCQYSLHQKNHDYS